MITLMHIHHTSAALYEEQRRRIADAEIVDTEIAISA
jgi:hypothetical protein